MQTIKIIKTKNTQIQNMQEIHANYN